VLGPFAGSPATSVCSDFAASSVVSVFSGSSALSTGGCVVLLWKRKRQTADVDVFASGCEPHGSRSDHGPQGAAIACGG